MAILMVDSLKVRQLQNVWTLKSIYNRVTIFISNTGDIIMQIDRQELSHMSLAQATLALSTSSPLLTLTVYRPAMEDGKSCIAECDSYTNLFGSSGGNYSVH